MKGIELAKKVVELIDDKKGEDVVCFDLSEVSSLTDFFIIATGGVDTHVRAIAENMMVELKKADVKPFIHEGVDMATWVCVDYGDVIVHIMREAERKFYNLESIWGGCKRVEF